VANRWGIITDAVRDAIRRGEYRPGDRLPSESELAARWNVCRMTAHRAMDELHRQGFVTRKRRVGTFVLPPPGEAVPDRRVYQVAVLFFNTDRYPQAAYLTALRSALPDDARLLLCDTRNDPAREEACLIEMAREADALCCYATCRPEVTPALSRIADSGKPLVFVDTLPVGILADAVITDNYGSTRDALRRLRERGHRRIAFVASPRWHVSSVWERRKAFVDALKEAGVADPESLILPLPRVSGHTFESYVSLLRGELQRVFAGPEPPTALFCLEDFFLTATLDACDRNGVAVPDDVEILSFSDVPSIEPRVLRYVHRLSQNTEVMGRLAAERLLARLSGKPAPVETCRVPARWHPALSVPETFKNHDKNPCKKGSEA
jgi:GntR family transcriptional regulator, arabinose operon transcriptional repressor